MLRTVRDLLQRTFSTKTPPTPEQAERAAATARQDRAGSITDLRSEVRRLQQDIKDGSDSLERLTGAERTAQEGKIASLQRELEQKQRELGGLQARV